MTIRDDVRAMLDGPGPNPDATDAGPENWLADVPAELVGTVLGHFADTASLADADALAPIVTAASPIPFDAQLDGVGDRGEAAETDRDPDGAAAAEQDESDGSDPDDHDPDDFDRADMSEGPDSDSEGEAVVATDQDPGDFDHGADANSQSSGSMADTVDDRSPGESFGSGESMVPIEPSDESEVGANVVDEVSWDDDPFAVDDLTVDPVDAVTADEPLAEFAPVDIDDADGFGVDPADGDFDGLD